MYLKLNAVWLSGKGDTYRIWAVFVYVCIGRLSGCGLQGAVEGMRFRVEETLTGFGRFLCTCVSEGCRDVAYRVLWRGYGFRWRRHVQDSGGFCVRVYRKVVGMWLIGCCVGDAVSGGGDTYRIRAVFVYVCGGGEWFLCTSVWYRCRVVIYRVWEEGTFLVCYTKKKEMTLLVIPHEISLRYVLEATSP